MLSIIGIFFSKQKQKEFSSGIVILSTIYYELGLSVIGVILLTINVLIQFIERRLKNEITI